jgi:hypothetical protein
LAPGSLGSVLEAAGAATELIKTRIPWQLCEEPAESFTRFVDTEMSDADKRGTTQFEFQ